MEKTVDYRRGISLMTTEEFVRFCSIMKINLNKFHVRHNDRLKQKVGDLISKSYHKLRNDPEGFRKFNSVLSEAFYRVDFE